MDELIKALKTLWGSYMVDVKPEYEQTGPEECEPTGRLLVFMKEVTQDESFNEMQELTLNDYFCDAENLEALCTVLTNVPLLVKLLEQANAQNLSK